MCGPTSASAAFYDVRGWYLTRTVLIVTKKTDDLSVCTKLSTRLVTAK